MRAGRASVLCVVLAACSYDWTPGSAPTDASTESSSDGGGGADAPPTDGAGVDSPVAEAGADVAEEPPSCAELEGEVTQDFAAAVSCTPSTSACTVTTTNECGCTVVLGASGQATTTYEGAVASLKSSSCPLGCSGSCGPTPTPGQCVVADATAVTYACQQD